MRLTCTYDLDTENKQRIFNRIVGKPDSGTGRAVVYRGRTERLHPALLRFTQTVIKVSSMQYYKRVILNLFYEQLAEFVGAGQYNPRRNVADSDYDGVVDYRFDIGPSALPVRSERQR